MSDEKSLIRLQDEDWDLLLPGKDFALGKTVLRIKPLGLKDTSTLLKRLVDLIELWGPIIDEYAKTKFKDKQAKEMIAVILPKLSEMIATQAVDLLSLMSGVVKEDIGKLPPKIATELGVFCITINIESYEGLEKNFTTLADLIAKLTQGKSLLGV